MSSPPPTSPPPMVWPAPPGGNVVPFPLPWGQTGCCPPGGMSSLMQCYNDIQAATAFICQVMVDCVNNNPAVTNAIIAAIEKSGSSLPTTGVTNGSDAQPGQVGEFVEFTGSWTFAGGTTSSTTLSLGVLQPGDWDVWAFSEFSVATQGAQFELIPIPVGFSNNLPALVNVGSGNTEVLVLASPAARASLTVPTLIAMQLTVVALPTGGTMDITVDARRMR